MHKYSLLTLFLSSFAFAGTEDAAQNHQADERIQQVFGGQKAEIKPYDDQLKEIIVGAKSYFATHDGRYIFAGPVFDTEKERDIVAEREDQHRHGRLASLPESLYVSYPATNNEKHEITVFTDIDCPYCRKMHNHMDAFNDNGVTVNYVMLPRAGLGSTSYEKTASALCTENPAATITRAMQGDAPESQTCAHTLKQQLQLAMELQISSTPAIVLPNGKLRLGLVNPEQLSALLTSNSP